MITRQASSLLPWAWTVTSLPLFELAQDGDVGTAGTDWN